MHNTQNRPKQCRQTESLTNIDKKDTPFSLRYFRYFPVTKLWRLCDVRKYLILSYSLYFILLRSNDQYLFRCREYTYRVFDTLNFTENDILFIRYVTSYVCFKQSTRVIGALTRCRHS